MKQKLLLIISIISLFILEIELENYGVGYGLFNPNLPYKLNTDFDKYQGFDIEEDGFITVLGKNSILFDEKGDTLRVKEVLNYGKNEKQLFVEIKDNLNNIRLVEIRADLSIKIFKKNEILKKLNLRWLNVSNAEEKTKILKLGFYLFHFCNCRNQYNT